MFLSTPGSIVKASEKCITSVQGGRAEFTAALAWEKRGVSPDSTTYQNWIKSTIDNPTVIGFEVSRTNKHLKMVIGLTVNYSGVYIKNFYSKKLQIN